MHWDSVKFWPENSFFDPQYSPKLQRMGVEIFYGADFVGQFENWIRVNGHVFDVVLLSLPHVSINIVDHITNYTAAVIMYYGHDIHYHRMATERLLGSRLIASREEQEVEFR